MNVGNINENILDYFLNQNIINKNEYITVKKINEIKFYKKEGNKKIIENIPAEKILLEKGFVNDKNIFQYFHKKEPNIFKGEIKGNFLKFVEPLEETLYSVNIQKQTIKINNEIKEITRKRLNAAIFKIKNIDEIKKDKNLYKEFAETIKENNFNLKTIKDIYFIISTAEVDLKLIKELSVTIKNKTGGKEILPVYFLNQKSFYYSLITPEQTYKKLESLVRKLNNSANAESEIKDGGLKKLIELMFNYSLEVGASDIHVEPDDKTNIIRIRKDGILQFLFSLKRDYGIFPILETFIENSIEKNKFKPIDAQLTFDHIILGKTDVRLAQNKTIFGDHVVMRLLPSGINAMTLDQINYTKRNLNIIRKKLLTEPNGILLITGPTGSGKTNTLAAILKELSKLETKVLSVEDPVEIKLPLVQQIQVNNQQELTAHAALKSFLRQDPDIMFIGEIRDKEMATKAVEGAMTGHLMLATLHTNDSVSSLMRLRDIGVGNLHIANTLRGVVAQRLLRSLCPYCKKKVSPEVILDNELYRKATLRDTGNIYEHNSEGCPKCGFTGYKGRVPVAEIFVVDENIQNQIIQGQSPNDIISYIKQFGFTTLLEEGKKLIEQGKTDIFEVIRVLGDEKDAEFNYNDYE